MLLTTTVHITQKEEVYNILYFLCFRSARLYNVGLYAVRQRFFETGEYLTYAENCSGCKINNNYTLLITDIGQQTLRLVDRDMKSFFALNKKRKKSNYAENVRLPRYKDKNGLMMCVVQGRSVSIKGDKARIGLTEEFRQMYRISDKYTELTIPKHLRSVERFNEVRIVPKYGGKEFSIEFVYESSLVKEYEQAQGDGFMSIDIGTDNLMACAVFSNGRSNQFIIDGRHIKSINAYYNKTAARLKSSYAEQGMEHETTKRLLRIYNGRANRINNYFSKSAEYVIKTCLEHGVTTLVVGYNKEMKQEINIGKVNNQNFVYIPFDNLRNKLRYKCELHGIKFVLQEESYTSKASCLDGDEIPVYGKSDGSVKFSGRRVKRGLYRSSDGSLLNADINGSVNILRKYCIESKGNWLCHDLVRALVNVPCRRISPAQAPSFRMG